MTSILLRLRVALKNRLAYAICIFSLTIAFAVSLLVLRFVQSENSYDLSSADSERIYRLTVNRHVNGAEFGDAIVQFPVAKQLHSDYSGIEAVTRVYRDDDPPLIKHDAIKFVEPKHLFVEDNFFSFFPFQFVAGDPTTALKEPNSIVLSREAAARYFKGADPMGKTLLYNGDHPMVVTGVVENKVISSHISFDMLMPLSFRFGLWKVNGGAAQEENWFITRAWSYVKFNDISSKNHIASELPSFVRKYFPEAYKEWGLGLQSLSSIHTTSHYDTEIETNVSDTYLKIFQYVVGAILLFSIFNFINLNTAILLNRSKEFSVKGFLGSSKWSLFREVVLSTWSISFASFALALLLALVLQHEFNTLMGASIAQLSFANDWKLFVYAIVFITGMGVAVSIQPYLALTSDGTSPDAFAKKRKQDGVRKVGVSVQIASSFVLILGTIVISKQINFLKSTDLGFEPKNLIALPARPAVMEHYEAFKSEVKKLSGVDEVAWISNSPGTGGLLNYRFVPEGFDLAKPMVTPFVQVEYDFAKVVGVKLRAGRDFDASLPGDRGQTYLVNRAFLKSVAWEDDYLGKQLQMFKPGEQVLGYSGKIIGLLDDYHTESLHFPVKPLIVALHHARSKPGNIVIKVKQISPEVIEKVGELWKVHEPDWPFAYSILSDEIDTLYKNEGKLYKLTLILSVLAILISFVGLFGVNSVSILKKYKPVAIKKVLGASQREIFVESIRSEFIFLLTVLVVATPCAYVLAIKWLNDFQYRAAISFKEFSEAGLLVVLLVISTLLFHLIKLVSTNPLTHIKRE